VPPATARTGLRFVVPAALVAVVVIAAMLLRPGGDGPPSSRGSTPAPPASASAIPEFRVAASPTVSAASTCARTAHPFAPTRMSVAGATAGAAVVTPPRDANGVPGTPPLTDTGKRLFAWDTAQGIRPGDPRGNVLVNAHTWPDGTALGNALLATLHHGSRIVVHGRGGARLCYRVTEEVEVPASRGLPRYYATHGPPRLAILVCSGRRLGPGNWTHRTVWFASPST